MKFRKLIQRNWGLSPDWEHLTGEAFAPILVVQKLLKAHIVHIMLTIKQISFCFRLNFSMTSLAFDIVRFNLRNSLFFENVDFLQSKKFRIGM